MKRLTEEQKAILSCYSGTKEEVIAAIEKAIIFIEDFELRESTQVLIEAIENMSVKEYAFTVKQTPLMLFDIED